MPNNRNARRSKKKASRPPSIKAAEEAVASGVTAAPSESQPLSDNTFDEEPASPVDTASADPSCALPEEAGATADPASQDSSSTVPAESHPDGVSEAETAESQDDHQYLSIFGSRVTGVSAEAQSKFLSPEEQAKHLDPVIATYLEKLDARKIVVLALHNMATEDSPEFTEIQEEVNAWVALNIGPPIKKKLCALAAAELGRRYDKEGQLLSLVKEEAVAAEPGKDKAKADKDEQHFQEVYLAARFQVRRDYRRPLRDRDSKSKIVSRCREICKSERGERFAQIVNGVYNSYNKYYKKSWTNWSEEDRHTGWVIHAMQTGANPELVRPWEWGAFGQA
ncbi:hypothetical protein QBC37DRAFT_374784 [Rhypophila decipiens]|uniref:Uncharacterized protein n=1 Tax=Rhypophila decipiens TaxID=261697 RepID=A0AAN7B727_9PEZI|nr:hypothetical protein QBC37DRAFT_374784 [Rhypophila decipiens]